MAILKKGDGYNGADFQIVTGDDPFDEEFKDDDDGNQENSV